MQIIIENYCFYLSFYIFNSTSNFTAIKHCGFTTIFAKYAKKKREKNICLCKKNVVPLQKDINYQFFL